MSREPAPDSPRVIAVVPTYDEAENIPRMLDALLALPLRLDVLVVDDGSPDGTGEIVAARAAADPRVRLLARTSKDGLGPAYLAGFAAALEHDPDAVVQIDADGSHDPADVPRLVAALDGADLAIGSRYVPGGRIAGWTAPRRALSREGNRYARLWLPVGVRDLTGGFKAWRAPILAKVVEAGVTTVGYGFQIETTVRARALGARIVEVPITFHDRDAGRSKMSAAVSLEAFLRVPTFRRLLR